MIEANKAIFSHLDAFLRDHGTLPENAGQARWIATNDEEEEDLKRFRTTAKFPVGPSKMLMRLDAAGDQIFASVGFDQNLESQWFPKIDVNAGLLTAILADGVPRPVGTVLQVESFVTAQDHRDAQYDGHDPRDARDLFPNIGAFAARDTEPGDNAKIFFDFVLSESRRASNWVSPTLCNSLRELYTLELIGVPYSILSRSVLDYDQSSLFLALYRCLEALYSRSGAERLRLSLSIPRDWEDIARGLEDELGWRPGESGSLESLVRMGAPSEWTEINDAISPAIMVLPGEDRALAASKAIYKLRNAAVHFRPSTSRIDLNRVDWEKLCCSMVTLICYVYSEIFQSL